MGNKSSLMLRDEEIKTISDETGFTPAQVEKLFSRFAHLDRNNVGSLSKSDLMSIPELAINPLCDRLIQMFFSQCDQGDEERINFPQFVQVLAAFRSSSSPPHVVPKTPQKTVTATNLSKARTGSNQNSHRSNGNSNHGSPLTSSQAELNRASIMDFVLSENLRDKLLFVFKIYDADNDGRISFGDLRSILKMMVGNYIEDVQLDKIATRAFVEVDQDSDGFIEFGEFCRVFAGKDLDDKLRVKFFS